jgi:hypothetical protein
MGSQPKDSPKIALTASSDEFIQQLRETAQTNINSNDDPFTTMARRRILDDIIAELDQRVTLKLKLP